MRSSPFSRKMGKVRYNIEYGKLRFGSALTTHWKKQGKKTKPEVFVFSLLAEFLTVQESDCV